MNRAELKQILEAGGFDKSYYSLDVRPRFDAYYLYELDGGRWAIDSFERGRAWTVGSSSSEDEACRALYRLLQTDSSSRR